MPQDAIQHNCVLLVPRLLCFVFSLQQPVSPTAKLKKSKAPCAVTSLTVEVHLQQQTFMGI